MTDRHHYKECGLDFVYLLNGYTVHETKYGRGVSIENVEGLHKAIARNIITQPHAIRGQEARFLRSMLDMSQEALAGIVGVQRGTITRWEKENDKPIDGPADRLLRYYYAGEIDGNDLIKKVKAILAEIDEMKFGETDYVDDSDVGWKVAA